MWTGVCARDDESRRPDDFGVARCIDPPERPVVEPFPRPVGNIFRNNDVDIGCEAHQLPDIARPAFSGPSRNEMVLARIVLDCYVVGARAVSMTRSDINLEALWHDRGEDQSDPIGEVMASSHSYDLIGTSLAQRSTEFEEVHANGRFCAFGNAAAAR